MITYMQKSQKNIMGNKRFKKLDLQFEYLSFGINVLGLWKRVNYYFKDHSLFTVIKKNKLLMNSQISSKKIYICALGPSLKKVDLNCIDGDSFVVNSFYKYANKLPSFIPTYYMMIDDGYAGNASRQVEIRQILDIYLHKGTKFFFNSKLHHAPFLKDYTWDNIYFFSTFRGDFNPQKKYDMSKVMPISGNVVSFAVLLSILMGYKEIYLLGCDFNSFTTRKPMHCYDDSSEQKTLSLSQDLIAYAYVAKYHERLQELASREEVKIFNATKCSLIDAYPFVDLPWA